MYNFCTVSIFFLTAKTLWFNIFWHIIVILLNTLSLPGNSNFAIILALFIRIFDFINYIYFLMCYDRLTRSMVELEESRNS